MRQKFVEVVYGEPSHSAEMMTPDECEESMVKRQSIMTRQWRLPMSDPYTKIILTVIASCLLAIAAGQVSPSANAQFGLGCDGSPQAPCYVRLIP